MILHAARAPLIAAMLLAGAAAAAGDFAVIPAPAVDQSPTADATETLTLAGGCFWGVQGVFQHVKGVTKAVSGYAGGQSRTAHYELVSGGDTGHAESVQITFDPHQVSLGTLLQIYFSVAHDPTQVNKQGPDHGPQYRSAVFPADERQAELVKAYIAQLDAARVYRAPIVTKIEMNKAFYPAEDYHQDYLTLYPDEPYIAYNDIPKVEHLAKTFPALYRPDPVLVSPKKP